MVLPNPVLVLGGTGTVGSRIAKQLSAAGIPALVASREGAGTTGVVFDWNDRNTWDAPFDQTRTHPQTQSQSQSQNEAQTDGDDNKDKGILSVYLVAPLEVVDASSLVMEYVGFARARGARRFVLQSASAIDPGGPAMGKVHAYLRELGTRGEIEWAVLRPTWFQQDLAEQECHLKSIRDESKLYSATGDGKIAWVSADDTAAVAVQALTREDPPNTEFIVTGPELLSYDDVAHMLTRLLGRKIVHVDLSTAELAEYHQAHGMPQRYAQLLSSFDTPIKFGSENRTNDVVLSVTGASPRPFREFLESAKSVWILIDSGA